jgi:DNA-binding response OmpR family regulator
MSIEQILIIEDDQSLNQGLCKALKTEHRQVVSCRNLQEAREQLRCQSASLVLLDVNLPDGSGLDLLREIRREKPELPVILLTANDTDWDIVEGLEQGADDYITKPFSLAVLRARVNARLRSSQMEYHPNHYETARYQFDFDRMLFQVKGVAVELSKTEQKLLRLLVEHPGVTMQRSVLVDRIWTDGAEYVDENALSVTVRRLRNKLEAQDDIQTVYGIGYRWREQHG